MNENLVALFRHNTWANLRLIEFCKALPEAQRDSDATVEGVRGPIGSTLLHIVLAQEGYLAGMGRGQPPASPDFPGWDALLERARASSEAFEKAAAELSGEEVFERRRGDRDWQISGRHFLIQAINHGTEHRSQVATVLTQLGVEPPALDGWAYSDVAGLVSSKPVR
jgi:uncharacterized damage-inducible protein DinB